MAESVNYFSKKLRLDVWQGSEFASDIDLLTIAYLQFYDTTPKNFLDLFWKTYKMTLGNICCCSTPPLSVQTIR